MHSLAQSRRLPGVRSNPVTADRVDFVRSGPIRSTIDGRGTRHAGVAPKSDNPRFCCTLDLGMMNGHGCNKTGRYPTLGPGHAACHGLGSPARGELQTSCVHALGRGVKPQARTARQRPGVSSDDLRRFVRFIVLLHLPPRLLCPFRPGRAPSTGPAGSSPPAIKPAGFPRPRPLRHRPARQRPNPLKGKSKKAGPLRGRYVVDRLESRPAPKKSQPPAGFPGRPAAGRKTPVPHNILRLRLPTTARCSRLAYDVPAWC